MTDNNWLYKEYTKGINEILTPFVDGNGFSIVREYKDPRLKEFRMMLKIGLNTEGELSGSVNLVKDRSPDSSGGYSLVDPNHVKLTVNNFIFNKDDFSQKNGLLYTRDGKKISVNNVIKNLEYNHLSFSLNLLQKINKIKFEWLVKIIFWLSDEKYSYSDVLMSRLVADRDHESVKEKKVSQDPLFKYFEVNKNILITFVIACIVVILNSCYLSHLDVTNLLVLFFGLALFYFMEKASQSVNKLINNVNDDGSKIQYLIKKSQGAGFTLKIKYADS